MRSHNGNTYLTYAGIILKHGRAANALENYHLARELLEPLSDEDSLEKLAQVYDGTADAIAVIGKSAGTNNDVRELYQRSLDTLQQLEAKHKLSDENADRQSAVRAKLTKYDGIAK